MKVGDLVNRGGVRGRALPLGGGLIIGERDGWDVDCDHEVPRWYVLWSGMGKVWEHCTNELRVIS